MLGWGGFRILLALVQKESLLSVEVNFIPVRAHPTQPASGVASGVEGYLIEYYCRSVLLSGLARQSPRHPPCAAVKSLRHPAYVIWGALVSASSCRRCLCGDR